MIYILIDKPEFTKIKNYLVLQINMPFFILQVASPKPRKSRNFDNDSAAIKLLIGTVTFFSSYQFT